MFYPQSRQSASWRTHPSAGGRIRQWADAKENSLHISKYFSNLRTPLRFAAKSLCRNKSQAKSIMKFQIKEPQTADTRPHAPHFDFLLSTFELFPPTFALP